MALALLFLLLYLAAALLTLLARPYGLSGALATPLSIAVTGTGLVLTGERCVRAVQTRVCGANLLYIQTVRRATARLTLRPERATLAAVFAEMVDLLESGQAVGRWRPLYSRGYAMPSNGMRWTGGRRCKCVPSTARPPITLTSHEDGLPSRWQTTAAAWTLRITAS